MVENKMMMELEKLFCSLETPAFVYDENRISKQINYLLNQLNNIKFNLLFPIKTFSFIEALKFINNFTEGFSVSSLFEAKLAKEITECGKHIHFTSPCLVDKEVDDIFSLCSTISLNSLNQFIRYYKLLNSTNMPSVGLRVNPQLSFVKDYRYNPCRKNSKLGIPIKEFKEFIATDGGILKNIGGVHFHSNCESSDFGDLLETVSHLDYYLSGILNKIEWVNLGGGYIWKEGDNIDTLGEAIYLLQRKYEIPVFLEFGKGIVGEAGYIISSVIDMFESDNSTITILDTTINHMPEVFEYQYKPKILTAKPNGKYKYIIAGSSCLSGDIFGQYKFNEPLKIGSRLIFENVGAYTMVKANMFNGINMPTVYAITTKGDIAFKKLFQYKDFIARNGG